MRRETLGKWDFGQIVFANKKALGFKAQGIGRKNGLKGQCR